MTARLILVRHGETDLSGRFCGHSDPELNARGREQVRELVRGWNASEISAIYSSDLLRARQTAEAVANAKSVPLTLLAELREIAFGDWEGLLWSEIESRFPESAKQWVEEYPRRSAPHGEVPADFEKRVLGAVLPVVADCAGTICIVSHGGVMRVLLRSLAGLNEDEAWALTRNHAQAIECEIPAGVARG